MPQDLLTEIKSDDIPIRDPEIYFNQGNALANLGRYEEAIAAQRK